MTTDEYKNARNQMIASLAANVAWEYKHNIKTRESFPLSYRVSAMKEALDALLRAFDGIEGEFGL